MSRYLLPLLAFLTVPAGAEEVIPVYYVDRPPLITTSADGKIGGPIGERAAQVFAAAKLKVEWFNEPGSRIISVLTMNHGAECSFGWYKNAEREAKVTYSLPFFLDPPAAGLLRADFPLKGEPTLAELLARDDVRLAVRQYVVYGDYIDGLIAKAPHLARVGVENVALVKMIHAGRADLAIMPQLEIAPVIAAAGLPPEDFRVVNFRDLPHPEYRYIVCAKQVDPAVMQRINQAIRDLSLP